MVEEVVAKQGKTLKHFSGYYNDGTYEGLSMAVRWWLSVKRDDMLKENEEIKDFVLKYPESAEAWQKRYKFNANSTNITFIDKLLEEAACNSKNSTSDKL